MRFDLVNLEVIGEPLPVVERIGRLNAATSLGVSRDGTLVYAPFGEADGFSLVWVDRRGNEASIAAPRRGYVHPRLSPDGTRIAVASNDGRGWRYWIWDLALETLTPMPDGTVGTFSVWSPDSKYLVFNSVTSGPASLARRAVDGTGSEQALTKAEYQQRPTAMSPDGRHLVFEQQTPVNSMNLMVVALDDGAPLAGTGTPRISALLDTEADERNASIAPDGRWVAYESNKSGQFQIYVKPFPNIGDAEYQISREGGRTPLWAPDGREVFFVNGSALMVAAVQLTPTFRAGNPSMLFEATSLVLDGRVFVNNTGRTYDVSRDGQRFLMLKDAAAARRASRPDIIVVQNWQEELKQRVPTR
jgi:serine/threonine-protein kinase